MIDTTRFAIAVAALSFAIIPLRLEAQEGSAHNADETGEVVVEHAEIVLSPSPAGMAAGYLAVFNGTEEEVALAFVESPAFRNVSLHRTETDGGVARMRPVGEPLRIPQNTELVMRPGGLHLMLTEPLDALRAGGTVMLELGFVDGSSETVAAELKGFGERPADHHHGEDKDRRRQEAGAAR